MTTLQSIPNDSRLQAAAAASLRFAAHQFLHVALQQQHGLLPDAGTSMKPVKPASGPVPTKAGAGA